MTDRFVISDVLFPFSLEIHIFSIEKTNMNDEINEERKDGKTFASNQKKSRKITDKILLRQSVLILSNVHPQTYYTPPLS